MDYFSLLASLASTSPVNLSDRISFAALICSFIFFLISLSISLRAIHESKRSADASEKSADAAVLSARVSAESVFIAEKSAEAGLRSAVAAEESFKSSLEANAFAKKQTEILETELYNTYLPKLLPIHSTVKIPKSEIHNAFYHQLFWPDPSQFELEVANVSNGNAYMVSSWLEIQDDKLIDFHEEASPSIYNHTYDSSYNFVIDKNDQDTQLRMAVEFTIRGEIFVTGGKMNFSPPRIPVLKLNETMKIFLPNYIVAIITHAVYKSWIDEPEYLHERIDSLIILKIKYKNGPQLESDDYTLRSYTLSLNDLQPVTTRTVDDLSDKVTREVTGFKISIDFNFVEEREILSEDT